MSSLVKIKRKINSIETIEKITKTMKLVATSNLKKNQNYFSDIKEFNKEFYKIYSIFSNEIRGNIAKKISEEKILWIVFTSSLGLCGSYNINLIKELEKKINIKNDKILLFGKKGYVLLKNKNLESNIRFYIKASNKDINYDFCSILSEKIINLIESKEFTSIKIFYNKFINSIEFKPSILNVFPIDNNLFKDDEKINGYIMFESNVENILEILQKQFFTILIYGALVETNVSENSSRRNSMESASKNAKDIKDNYLIQYNSKRQSKITQEINEIIGGFNASK